MELPPTGHEPIMVQEILQLLKLPPDAVVVDATLGRGGHASAMCEAMGEKGLLIGLDVDPRNLEFARSRLGQAPCRCRFFHANFSELADVLHEVQIEKVHAILADFGVSTNQLFDPHYGLSFSAPMPLDMRLDPRLRTTAADLVNKLPEGELADLLFNLAQERFSRRIARKIRAEREVSPILTTDRLADIVRSAIPSRAGAREKIDPATRTCLALRMAVNREMQNIEAFLKNAPRFLLPGGKLAVLTFQSMEDRAVKHEFRSAELTGLARILTKKPQGPSDAEIQSNPRSRSAKLRAIEKV